MAKKQMVLFGRFVIEQLITAVQALADEIPSKKANG